MLLSKLIEIQENGVFEPEVISGIQSREKLQTLAANCGWVKSYLPADQILLKTGKFIKGIKNKIDNEYIFNNTDILFENLPISGMDKTMDRILINTPNVMSLIVLYGAPKGWRGTSKYEVYDNTTGACAPIQKFGTLSTLGKFINNGGRQD